MVLIFNEYTLKIHIFHIAMHYFSYDTFFALYFNLGKISTSGCWYFYMFEWLFLLFSCILGQYNQHKELNNFRLMFKEYWNFKWTETFIVPQSNKGIITCVGALDFSTILLSNYSFTHILGMSSKGKASSDGESRFIFDRAFITCAKATGLLSKVSDSFTVSVVVRL